MKHSIVVLFCMLAISARTQELPTIHEGNYEWLTPKRALAGDVLYSAMFSGNTSDLEWLEMDACALNPSKRKSALQVPPDAEYLIIIRSGEIELSLPKSNWKIGRGSVAVLVPGEKFSLRTSKPDGCRFYLMRYRARNTPQQAAAVSFVTDWKSIPFKAHDKGGVRKFFEKPTAMFERLEMHVTTLNAGLRSHEPHTHRPEEIILMMDDQGDAASATEMLIGDHSFRAKAGDLYYVPSNLLHGIRNTGSVPCSYFAFQFR